MPVIPAILEAEIMKIEGQGQPRQKVRETHLNKISCAWWCMPLILAARRYR
jgi:hypothetical protein